MTCGEGEKVRTRTCPAAANCPGSNTETTTCSAAQACPGQSYTGVAALAPKSVTLAPNGPNPGLFQIRFISEI